MAKRAAPKSKNHMQLKKWAIYPVGEDGSWIEIKCPQPDCGGVSYVKRGLWLHQRRRRGFIGRPCTYCFKTARIPGSDE